MHHTALTSNTNFIMGQNVWRTVLFFCLLGGEKIFAAADLFRERKKETVQESISSVSYRSKGQIFNEAKTAKDLTHFSTFFLVKGFEKVRFE